MSGDRLDLSSDPNFTPRSGPRPTGGGSYSAPGTYGNRAASGQQNAGEQKKFVGIKFNCCGLYVRVYVNKDGTAYEGRCPRCAKPVKLKIGAGGTNNRFFEVY
ncbi:MAG: hypothetical protein ACRC2T_19365 [Thermoguttaceae bacterium]